MWEFQCLDIDEVQQRCLCLVEYNSPSKYLIRKWGNAYESLMERKVLLDRITMV